MPDSTDPFADVLLTLRDSLSSVQQLQSPLGTATEAVQSLADLFQGVAAIDRALAGVGELLTGADALLALRALKYTRGKREAQDRRSASQAASSAGAGG